jgi:hypothetical protein
MPDPVLKAFYRPASGVVQAMQMLADGVFILRDETGRTVDEIPYIAGEWVVLEGNRGWTQSDTEFKDDYDSFGHGRLFAPKSEPRELVQPSTGPEAAEFAQQLLRCSRDGTLICRVSDLFSEQMTALTNAADKVSARQHIQVLGLLRAAVGNDITFDPLVQGDRHMFDMLASFHGEEPPDGDDRANPGGGLMPCDIPGVVEEATRGMAPAGIWIAIDKMPGANLPQMKMLRDRLFSDLTDVRLSEVMVTFCPHTMAENPLQTITSWLKSEGEHRPLKRQPDFSNIAPGYVCEVDRFAVGGVEMIVVEDFMASYIYAWPDEKPAHIPGFGR